MAQVLRAANLVRELETNDFRVLKGIELGMRRYDVVPLEQISFFARIDKDETQFRIDRLHKRGILQRNSEVGYVGYQLISESYDVLAFHSLVNKNILVGVGDPIARGKESDVFFGKTPNDQDVAVKIHRIGQNSFRSVRKLRSYVQNRHHTSWLYISRLSAEKEFEALTRLDSLKLGTPQAFGQNRHIVVMSLIEGQRLNTITELQNPKQMMDAILSQVEHIFMETQMIHCDLSEFNIIITPQDQIILIDWPQWESAFHPNVHTLLTRDLQNIEIFFHKHYDLTFNVDELVANLIENRKEPKKFPKPKFAPKTSDD